MIDTFEFKCPTTAERCPIVDGYGAYLMKSMDAVLKMEQVVKARGREDSRTLESLAEWKKKIDELSSLEDFAAEVTAAAQLENCPGPIEADAARADQIMNEPEHLMALCPMIDSMFPSVE